MTGHSILILVSVFLPPKKELLRRDLEVLFALGDAVILFGDINSKNSNWKYNHLNKKSREMEAPCESLRFDIVTPLTPTYYPNNINYRPDILDIAPMRGVGLKLSCIGPLQWLNSDHRPLLMRIGSLIADCPPTIKIITNWQKVSAALEEIDISILNSIPNDIASTDDIDNAIGALTNHFRTVVESSSRTVSMTSDRRELPRDVIELIRDKNAALRCGQIPHIHKAYWGLAKALKTEGAVPTPALKRPDNSIAFDDREKGEYLADSLEHQCSDNPPYDLEHVKRVEEEVRHRVSLPPKDDLDPVTHNEVSKQIKGLRIRKALGRNTISRKALKCFSAPLVALLVEIFKACIQNCYFPTAWKEAVVIGIPKPRKRLDLPANYRTIIILSVLADVPWYVKNSVLHQDLELPTISKYMKDASERFFDVASSHPNPLLVSAVSYEPPPPHHFCRRPWNVLLDPPDDFTVKVEKLIELNKMAID
ncbi:RNA-directed DNA polymerase from mobile element jockey [Eumeta japonica]|uniref:RNA-directed DNA polymerase from mobile element jockey n=1 Tax=Eumeta variegata TaxID=151549 RepID=A0A4C1V0F5_EUMVA|nr:RNA-directed DNA polymerase from mobile element jockey [Eumeta japonica]